MNIAPTSNQISLIPGPTNSAREGLRTQEERFERNVAEVTEPESSNTEESNNRDRALVEQEEIVQAVRANARSLEAANQAIGTLIDLRV